MINHASAIFVGSILHRRTVPVDNRFRYRLFMMYLDLAELDSLFNGIRFWRSQPGGLALARFCREDYLAGDSDLAGDTALPLDAAVRQRVEQQLGFRPDGPIRMLTNLRYFGYIFNPVTFYYCWNESASRVDAIVAEITNTPWQERHAYVLDCRRQNCSPGKFVHFRFSKDFHVSPFMPMNMAYDWRFQVPDQQNGSRLSVHMINTRNQTDETSTDGRVFDANLALVRQPITPGTLHRTLISYPFMTVKVVAAIYWQALKLKLKGSPFYPHPKTTGPDASSPDTTSMHNRSKATLRVHAPGRQRYAESCASVPSPQSSTRP